MQGQRLIASRRRRLPLDADLAHQVERVERRLHLDVIVEVNINVASVTVPGADAPRPARERTLGIAAGIDLYVAVKPYVHEVRGDMEHLRPLASRVGDHQADVVLAKQCDELAGHEARM